jgi:hypothetical protein
MYHSRTKHIDVQYHWLRLAIDEQMLQLKKIHTAINEQMLQLKKIHTDDNVADMVTKAVPLDKLELCIKLAEMDQSN